MTPAAENLRVLLEARELDTFLEALEAYRQEHTAEPAVTALTQRVFPPALRQALEEERLRPVSLVRLYKMVRNSRLVLVENDLIVGINLRINDAFRVVEPDTRLPMRPLVTFEDVRNTKARQSPLGETGPSLRATEVKRIAIVSTFSMGTWSAVDAFDFRKNACASQQEREFLRAVRQFLPSLQAYPNLPLRNFIDIEKLEGTVPIRARNYAWTAQVDVLLCTADEDPVAGVELDSVHHDSQEAAERDELKNLLFKLAGLPLVRIRADDEKAVRAEDFYDLLMAEAQVFDAIRPRRMRPRREHGFLVPAEVVATTKQRAQGR